MTRPRPSRRGHRAVRGQVMVIFALVAVLVLAIAGEKEGGGGNNLLLTAEPDGQTAFHVTAALPKDAVSAASTALTFLLSSPDYPEMRVIDHFFAPEPHLSEEKSP